MTMSAMKSTGMLVAAVLATTCTQRSNGFVPPTSVGRHRTATMAPPATVETSIGTGTALSAIRRGGGRGRRPPPKKEFVPPMNGEIKQDELRVNVASKDGKDESLGIMSKADALAKAKELGGLDLILINANSDPPVCKIVDYSKYRYALEKKRKEKAKNSKATEIKEVKMSYKIGEHDYGVRLKAATKFIKQGNRVKATIMFRGREVQHDNLGVELLNRLAADMEDICNMEGRPKREGRNLGAIMSPRAEVVKAINDAKRQKEREKKKSKAESLAKKIEADEAKKDDEEKELNFLNDLLTDDEDDDLFDDDMDASLDDLLGKSTVTDDLFA